MNKLWLIPVILLAITAIQAAEDSCACTGYYVGSEVSESGNTLIGQTDDYVPYDPVSITQKPASDVPGRTIEWPGGFVYRFPDHTYAYVSTNTVEFDVGIGCYGTGSTNECGVAFTGSITIYGRDLALAADPLISSGMGESTAANIVGACASSAREGVRIIADIIDTYGSSESNVYMFADKDEAWYMEVYTGHQYVAVKLPKDKVSFFGNESSIIFLSGYTEKICSPGLLTLPDEKGFAVYEKGELNLMKTYNAPIVDYSHMRTWIGHHILAPSKYSADYSADAVYDHLFTPDRKVSVKDIMELSRNRYEGTAYCPDVTGVPVRVVGVETTAEAHILEIDASLPADMRITRWFCLSPTVYNAYIPVSSGADMFYEVYERIGIANDPNSTSAYDLFKSLNTLCTEERFSDAASTVEKDVVSRGVREFMEGLEDYYIQIWPQVIKRASELYGESPDKAHDYLDRCQVGMLKDHYDEVSALFQETFLLIQTNTQSNRERSSLDPMIDVGMYAKRYGWTQEIDGDTLILRNGDETVTVEASALPYGRMGRVTTSDGPIGTAVHRSGDSFRTTIDALGIITEKGQPVPIDYGTPDDGSKSNTWLIIGQVAVVAVALGGQIILLSRRQ